MGKINFEAINEHTNTKYGDFTGVIKIDGHSNVSSIYDLCKDYKFDTSNIFIIGFGLSESTIQGIGKRDEVVCSVFYVNKSEYGSNFEEIQRKIKSDGTLRLKKKDIDVKYSTIGKYIKRYEFIATTELTKDAQEIEIEDNAEE